MNVKEDIRPVTYFKSRIATILARINRTRRPMVITQNGEPRAVLQDADSYERMRAAIGLLKLLAQGEQDVRRGRVILQDRLFAGLGRKLKGKGRA